MSNAASSSLPSTSSELSDLLAALYAAPDDRIIKMATATLKNFMKNSACVAPMVEQIVENPRWQTRQLAAVLLRQRVVKIFPRLARDAQGRLKEKMLEQLTKEKERPVRLSLAALVASIAQVAVPRKEWPGLFDFLSACSQHSEAPLRELSMKLFGHLADTLSRELRPHFKVLRGIFINGLQDGDDRVRLAAVKAVETLINLIDPERENEVSSFKEIIPPFCNVVNSYVQAGADEVVSSALEVFDTLCQSSLPVLDDQLPSVVQLMLAVAANSTFELTTREKSCLFLSAIIEAKPNRMIKGNLVDAVHKTAVLMSIEPSEETDELTAVGIAASVLDAIFLNIPKRLFYSQTLSVISQLCASQNPFERRGGFMILSTMTEGCADLFSEQLNEIVAGVCKGTIDPEPVVRAAAWCAFTQLGDQLREPMAELHHQLFPVLLQSLNAHNEPDDVREKCCNSLDALCENLDGPAIVPFAPQLMTALVSLLPKARMPVQESIISAIKSIAAAAKRDFLPYFPTVMQLMMALLQNENDEFLRLRCRATECVGFVACAVGKETFSSHLSGLMAIVVKGMELDFFELRESSFYFFSKVAEMLGEDFQPLIMPVMSFVLASLGSDDGVMINEKEALDGAQGIEFSDEEADDDDDDEALEGGENMKFSIRSGALDEKVAAIACLCSVIEFGGKNFLPFVEKSLDALEELCEYPHPFIRNAVVDAELELLRLFNVAFPNPRQWKMGEVVEMHANTRSVVDALIPRFLDRLEGEDDRETAANACVALSQSLQMFGFGSLSGKHPEVAGKSKKKHQKNFDLLIEFVEVFLREKGPCQRPDDDEDEAVIADHDEILIDAVTDLIEDLAKSCGESFLPAFKRFFPLIGKFAEPEKPTYDRSMSIGCCAEVFCALANPAFMEPFVPQLAQLAIRGLADPDVEVRRNAAYLCGVLALFGGSLVSSRFSDFFEPLRRLFDTPADGKNAEARRSAATSEGGEIRPTKIKDFLGCRDNAVSAICKFLKFNTGALPVAELLPLVLSALPLTEDPLEAVNVYPVLIQLYQTSLNLVVPHTASIIRIFVEVLGDPAVDKEVQRSIIAFLKALNQNNGSAVSQVLSALPPAQQEKFQQFILQ